MTKKTLLQMSVATLAIVLAASPSFASHHGSPRHGNRQKPVAARNVPGHFDYYMLSLSLAPSFCAPGGGHQNKIECQQLTEDAFEQTPLTIHGMWPNLIGVSGSHQPGDCPGPALGTLPDALTADLNRYMPGGDQHDMPDGGSLQDHEWMKHGRCSGLSQADYFGAAVTLAKRADDTIGVAMRDQNMLGNAVKIDDLLDAVRAKDPDLAAAIIVDCQTQKGGGQANIGEIRVIIGKDLNPVPVENVRMRHNSGCPQGAGFVPVVSK